MNGIEKIICRINEDAAKAENAITEEAEEKIRRIGSERDARIAEIRAEADAKAKTEREEILRRAEQSGVTAGRDILLGAKREMIDLAFGTAAASFGKMSKKEYTAVLSAYLREAVSEREFANADDLTLVVPKKAPCTAEELIAAAGVTQIRKTEQSDAVSAGFLLKTGEIESPCTPDKLIAARKDAMTAEVAAVLFGA